MQSICWNSVEFFRPSLL